MCLVVQRERAQLAILGARAQAQAALGGDSAEKAFKDYVNASARVETEDTKKRMAAQLQKLKDIKEIRFQPIGSIEKTTKLPTIDAQALRDRGVFREQMLNADTSNRPQRARPQRKNR